MAKKERGQAALDFLMTYGWAILIIILVAAALFVLGIFDIGKIVGNKPVVLTEMTVAAYTLHSNGTFTVKLQNQVGRKVDVQTVNATYLGQTLSVSPNITNIGVGSITQTINVGAFSGNATTGESYAISLWVQYMDRNTNYSYLSSGTVNGIITP